MTAASTLRRAAKTRAYAIFYGLPARWRRRLVRLLVPTYTIGAVVLVRDADAAEPGRLLLVRQPPGRAWSLPAGLLDRGERPVDAAVRELAEETGVRVDRDAVRPCSPNAIVHTPGTWVDMVFEVRVPGDTPYRADGVEVIEVAWHPLDALPPLTPPTAGLLGNYGIGPLADPPGAAG
jgi:8-oxo-dGTP pyrophosphatase MutT (NUDIX family)